MIKISVIVPIYKVPLEYLRNCFDSLIVQTMQECEFILVSDGAPEAECSICETYSLKDSRFIFFNREHAGVSATRNFGIEQAQGEYITFVDSDDWIEKETYSLAYNYAKENDSDIVLWDQCHFFEKNKICGKYQNESIKKMTYAQKNTLIEDSIFTKSIDQSSAAMVTCKLFRKSLINNHNIRYNSDLIISEDRLFNITSYTHSNNISYFNSALYHYRIHPNSLAHKYTPKAFEEYIAFIEHFPQEIKDNYLRSISSEIIRCFFLSWNNCYMHRKNLSPFKERMREIIENTKTSQFRQAICYYDTNNFSKIIQLELFLIKHNIYLLIYLHGIKSLLKNIFSK
ncbi:glycosyltransferase [Fibrobacter sp. UWB13]|uniref:glycosyltransferase family 2 protein n=1 Tax=Fibrobacter sp. UWB13 TaxID=1896204 RepID=UPI000A0A6148|nr:glycosyltransferase [Fibrobacter sp. UWB13]SMG22659.1 Glycosyltransferase involved in cell wall bisynthesis [Fibrobacter sp. UWB13]